MIFVADESLEGPVIRAVRALGYHVRSIIETEPGISDSEVLDRALADQAILLTGDKDFGELVFRQGLPHFGVVLVRLNGSTAEEKAKIVAQTITAQGHNLELAFCVVTEKLVRIRPSLRH